MGDMITTSEAAKILGKTPRRVRQLAEQLGGVVSAFPGRMVFDRKKVLAWKKNPRLRKAGRKRKDRVV